MSDEITPALTAEEWNASDWLAERAAKYDVDSARRFGTESVRIGSTMGDVMDIAGPAAHAVAALCLYEQSFGFTQEEAEVLRHLDAKLDLTDEDTTGILDVVLSREQSAALRSIAAKVAALLPPL